MRRALAGRGAGGAVAVQAVALALPVVVAMWVRGPEGLRVLLAALVVALVWEAVFARIRGRRFGAHGATTAAIFAVLAPELSLWQGAVAVSVGVVLGELVFGGRGYGFVSAAAVALTVAGLGAPGAVWPVFGPEMALAVLPGAALLLWAGLLPWPVAVAFLGALSLAAPEAALPAAFVLVFVICDPTASAVTWPGRLAQGALAGALVGLFGGAEGLIFAALLASLFAPLLDEGAIALTVRRGRHG